MPLSSAHCVGNFKPCSNPPTVCILVKDNWILVKYTVIWTACWDIKYTGHNSGFRIWTMTHKIRRKRVVFWLHPRLAGVEHIKISELKLKHITSLSPFADCHHSVTPRQSCSLLHSSLCWTLVCENWFLSVLNWAISPCVFVFFACLMLLSTKGYYSMSPYDDGYVSLIWFSCLLPVYAPPPCLQLIISSLSPAPVCLPFLY